MNTEILFQPFTYKTLKLKNRFVMAPMTRSFSPGGIPTSDVAAYYRRRAEGDVGLILTEGTVIDRPASSNDPDIPRFHGPALEGWKDVVEDVRQAGGAIAPQIWHMGIVPPKLNWTPPTAFEGPSGLVKPDKPAGVAMTEEDIADTIEAFAKASGAAKKLGFSAVEIHGAHGYLIDQFFWEGLNKRTDRYGGGSLVERSRFAREVVQAIRKQVGEDFVVILRLSQWKQQDYEAKLAKTPQEMEKWLAPLAESGVDIFHCSQRRFWEPEFEGSTLNFAGWAKKLTSRPTITVGSIGLSGEFVQAFRGESSTPQSIDGLIERFERGEFDLVAIGRVLISDPLWVKKIREGRTSDLIGFARDHLSTLR